MELDNSMHRNIESRTEEVNHMRSPVNRNGQFTGAVSSSSKILPKIPVVQVDCSRDPVNRDEVMAENGLMTEDGLRYVSTGMNVSGMNSMNVSGSVSRKSGSVSRRTEEIQHKSGVV